MHEPTEQEIQEAITFLVVENIQLKRRLEEVESFVDEAIFIKAGEVLKVTDLEQERITSGRSLADIYMDIM